MSSKAKNPFAGIKLTEQTSFSGGLDQQLFSRSLRPAPKPEEEPVSQETRNLDYQELPQQPELTRRFDVRKPATEKQTFTFSLDEVAALDELKLELRRKFDLKTTKYELARLAIHALVTGYEESGTDSLLIRSLREKRFPGNRETRKPVSQEDGNTETQETG